MAAVARATLWRARWVCGARPAARAAEPASPGGPLGAAPRSPRALQAVTVSAVMWARFQLTSRPQWALAMA